MKSVVKTAVSCLSGLAVLTVSVAAFAADVVVHVSGVKEAAGPLYVGLQTREQFMKNDGDHGVVIETPSAGELSVTIPNVPAGEYAPSLWHDVEGDGVFDRDENGAPLDGWAMAGGPFYGPPQFDDAKIDIDENGAVISLEMIYPAE